MIIVPNLKPLMRLAALLVTSLALTGCAAGDTASPTSGTPNIVTSIYPVHYVASIVAGPDATVTSLIPPGADAHHGEISLRQIRRLKQADLLVYLPAFQAAVDDAAHTNPPAHTLAIDEVIDLKNYTDGHDDHEHDHDHGSLDPHFWLDPENLAQVTDALGEQLAVLNPEKAANYRARAQELSADLRALKTRYETELANCARPTLVVSHAAFGYLTDPLNLAQIGIAGLDPDSEPSLARIREIRDIVADQQVTTIFYESPTNPYVAQKVADSLGLQTAFLDPLETQNNPDQDYLTVMEQNLSTLTNALECQ